MHIEAGAWYCQSRRKEPRRKAFARVILRVVSGGPVFAGVDAGGRGWLGAAASGSVRDVSPSRLERLTQAWRQKMGSGAPAIWEGPSV